MRTATCRLMFLLSGALVSASPAVQADQSTDRLAEKTIELWRKVRKLKSKKLELAYLLEQEKGWQSLVSDGLTSKYVILRISGSSQPETRRSADVWREAREYAQRHPDLPGSKNWMEWQRYEWQNMILPYHMDVLSRAGDELGFVRREIQKARDEIRRLEADLRSPGQAMELGALAGQALRGVASRGRGSRPPERRTGVKPLLDPRHRFRYGTTVYELDPAWKDKVKFDGFKGFSKWMGQPKVVVDWDARKATFSGFAWEYTYARGRMPGRSETSVVTVSTDQCRQAEPISVGHSEQVYFSLSGQKAVAHSGQWYQKQEYGGSRPPKVTRRPWTNRPGLFYGKPTGTQGAIEVTLTCRGSLSRVLLLRPVKSEGTVPPPPRLMEEVARESAAWMTEPRSGTTRYVGDWDPTWRASAEAALVAGGSGDRTVRFLPTQGSMTIDWGTDKVTLDALLVVRATTRSGARPSYSESRQTFTPRQAGEIRRSRLGIREIVGGRVNESWQSVVRAGGKERKGKVTPRVARGRPVSYEWQAVPRTDRSFRVRLYFRPWSKPGHYDLIFRPVGGGPGGR